MEGCYYISIWGQAFGWTLLVPFIVTIFTMLITMVTHESIFAIYGFYLWIPQLLIWNFQVYFGRIHANPICQQYHTFAFPSNEAFYIFAILGSFFTYAYYVPSEQSWFSWLLLYCISAAGTLILIYMQYNYWWEILFSGLVGYVFGAAFIIVCRYFIKPKIRYLNFHFPFELFEYRSEYIKRGSYDSEICEALKRVESYIAASAQ